MKLIATLVLLAITLAAVNAGGCPYSGSQGHGHGSRGGSMTKTTVENFKLKRSCPVTAGQRSTLLLAIKEANKDGTLGAKVGLRYVQAHPEAHKLFPSLKSSAPADLLTNTQFVAKSSVCFAAVKQLLSGRYFDKSKGCPYTAKTRGHYTTAQQLGFGKALVESVVAELGDGITPEVRSALQATVFAVRSAAGVCPIDKQHRQSMASTLKAANQDGSLGPKTFTNLFKAHPEFQKTFDAKGGNLNTKSSTCLSALSLYFNGNFFGATRGCPFTASANKYSYGDKKKFCVAMLAAVKENGATFDAEAVKAFRAAFANIKKH